MLDPRLRPEDATIGIVTALDHEYFAVREVLGCQPEVPVPGEGAGCVYALARVPALGGGHHVVAVARLAEMGNDSAAVRATLMKQHCPNVRYFIMCGIAGGVPNPQDAEHHVRLGDIVVSGRGGVIQYDYGMDSSADGWQDRSAPRPPSAGLLDAVSRVRTNVLGNQRPWEPTIDEFIARNGKQWKRPPAKTDILQDGVDTPDRTNHPRDEKRKGRRRRPRVFEGNIAAANTLLKNPTRRDDLRKKFGVKAVEMEGSGIANAAWYLDLGYLVIRGICDYCNPKKGNRWQKHAALAAAAYCRAVLEATPAVTLMLQTYSTASVVGDGKPTTEPVVDAEIAERLSNEVAPRLAVREEALVPTQLAPIDQQSLIHAARRFEESIAGYFDVLEFEEAFRSAKELNRWLLANAAYVPEEIATRLYILLARSALDEASRNPEERATLLSRAQHFISKVKNGSA